jgi:hypothetical protein
LRLKAAAKALRGAATALAVVAACASVASIGSVAATEPSLGPPEPSRLAAPVDRPIDGDTYDISIVVSGVDDMAAFDATLLYSTDALSPTAVSFGPFLPDGSTILGPDYSNPGRVAFGSYSATGEAVTGTGVVATADFVLVGLGSPGLVLDHEVTAAFGADGSRLDADFSLEWTPFPVYLPTAYAGLE